jgi:outer membrane protein OmpA-like peptidoglycan-associated protein
MAKPVAIPASSIRALALSGAALVLVANLLVEAAQIVAPARAEPAYKADAVIYFFNHETGGICIGTEAECPVMNREARFVLVDFDADSEQLTQTAKESLDQFVKALKDPRLSWRRFEIDGHTDAAGAESYNNDLSERRASAVAGYLVSQGLPALTTKGFGKSKLLVANPFSPKNRRVEARALDQVR